jgi:hypothetical protein
MKRPSREYRSDGHEKFFARFHKSRHKQFELH